jgi:hypothetical protein
MDRIPLMTMLSSNITNRWVSRDPRPYADLGELVAGIKPGRVREGKNHGDQPGPAMDDMAVAPEIYPPPKPSLGTILSVVRDAS